MAELKSKIISIVLKISKQIVSVGAVLLYVNPVHSQLDVIEIKNPSFEGTPMKGGNVDTGSTSGSVNLFQLEGWIDCGKINFPNESPPDIHPTGAWSVTKNPSDGNSYLGLVTRDNDTYESVSQLLSSPLQKKMCYTISFDAARAERYLSASRYKSTFENDASDVNYHTPIVVRIWGGKINCDTKELLVESRSITGSKWRKHELSFTPSMNIQTITVEAYYEVPVLSPYNGHILIDNLSHFEEVECKE